MSGRLFILEGPDGVGKSTLAEMLCGSIRAENPCDLYSFPGRERGSLGELVYDLYHSPATRGVSSITPAAMQALQVAAQIEVIATRIVPALQKGRNVVLDRFWWSTMVYGIMDGVDRKVLSALVKAQRYVWATHTPHLVILLRADQPRDREGMDLSWWRLLRDRYEILADAEAMNHPVLKIENSGNALDTRDAILRHVSQIEGTSGCE